MATIRLEGTLTIQGWDEAAFDESAPEAKLSRADVRIAFAGDVEGASHLEFLMLYGQDGMVPFVGLERVSGRVRGGEASFALIHSGVYEQSGSRADVRMPVGGSTGALAGASGSGRVLWLGAPGEPGRYELDVELPN